MPLKRILCLLPFCLLVLPVFGQVGNYLDAEEFYARTKQVNQFIRRFNGEEDLKGVRINTKDKTYRSQKLRKKYLPQLIDQQNQAIVDQLTAFGVDIIEGKPAEFLDFYSPDWFAEVHADVRFEGRNMPITFFLKLEEANGGWKWVIDHIQFAPYQGLFDMERTPKEFLNPLSHELYFMPLNEAMQDPARLEDYASKNYTPDVLTLFLYDMKRGRLQFKGVNNVHLHFFQLEGWYFELSEFNRSGKNAGWLISNLVKAGTADKEKLKAYILAQ
ncbi:hypothetical protein [Persicobacter diffluens]|uniref:Uncharacterized protein n=1 Tax=Persicobacter diffluens TaxID=981 RepID=A0AAN4VXE0_9BACT|nr:hypothetical protein PEDI_06320 [Persicobacter diffluens]